MFTNQLNVSKKVKKKLIVFFVALLILGFVKYFTSKHDTFFDSISLFILGFIFLMIEVYYFIDKKLNQKISWTQTSAKRWIYQYVITVIVLMVMVYFFIFIAHGLKEHHFIFLNRKMEELFFPSLLIILLIVAFDVGFQFFRKWKNSLIEIERYKTESSNAQLQNLRNQLNPHFLFNNLSVLSTLVYQNQDKAVDFINELSKVYRYVLEDNRELTTLEAEIDFLNHYIYLLKIRFEQKIDFLITIDNEFLSYLIPPMCLQTLVENTIQHNEASKNKPLLVKIYTQNQAIVVENNLQPRNENIISSKIGLQNIKSRYRFFTDAEIVVETNNVFKVILPLIAKKRIF